MKKKLNEIQRLQKIAGLLKEEDIDLSNTPQFIKTKFQYNPNWEEEEVGPEDEGAFGSEIVALYKLPSHLGNGLWDFHLSIDKTPEGKYYVHFFEDDVKKSMQTQYDTLSKAQQVAADLMDDIVDSSNDDTERPEYD